MRKYIVVIFLGIFALSVSSSPICNINQELNKDTAAKLSEFRDQTYSTCLTCADSSCKLKAWPEEKKGDEAVCKLLFCTPSYVSKFFEIQIDLIHLQFSHPNKYTAMCTLVHNDYDIMLLHLEHREAQQLHLEY